MEIREWATRVLSADTIEEKLITPSHLTDQNPGPAILWKTPTRPSGMGFSRHTREDKLPTFQNHGSQDNRAICLHRFGGHELLAVEIMAYALLAFPDAPRAFRKGVANTLKEEQEHVRLYMHHMKLLGIEFGDLPLFCHFWKQIPYLTTPIQYLSTLALTFEMANLDFAPLYRDSFKRHGDPTSAALMEQIIKDEISHVSFGMHWFKRLRVDDDRDDFTIWKEELPPNLAPRRGKGFVFNEENRQKARVPNEWIAQLREL